MNFSDPFGLFRLEGAAAQQFVRDLQSGRRNLDDPIDESQQSGQTRQGFGVLQQVGTPEKPEYAALYLAAAQTGARPTVLAANVAFSDKPGVIGLLRVELTGQGRVRGRYVGTLTFEGESFAVTINIDRLGLIEFGSLKAVPKVR